MSEGELDPFVQCPYNKEHYVPLSRIQIHIVKCQQKYPPLKICPYNATHRFPESEFQEHVKTCPFREKIFPLETSKVTGALTTPSRQPRDFLPETDPNHEIWVD